MYAWDQILVLVFLSAASLFSLLEIVIVCVGICLIFGPPLAHACRHACNRIRAYLSPQPTVEFPL
jgi:hypothetical protein